VTPQSSAIPSGKVARWCSTSGKGATMFIARGDTGAGRGPEGCGGSGPPRGGASLGRRPGAPVLAHPSWPTRPGPPVLTHPSWPPVQAGRPAVRSGQSSSGARAASPARASRASASRSRRSQAWPPSASNRRWKTSERRVWLVVIGRGRGQVRGPPRAGGRGGRTASSPCPCRAGSPARREVRDDAAEPPRVPRLPERGVQRAVAGAVGGVEEVREGREARDRDGLAQQGWPGRTRARNSSGSSRSRV
jgi:hypothetical protein